MKEERYLTADHLRSQGITFEEDKEGLPRSLELLNLPDHVIPLCEELLMFDKSLREQDIDHLGLGDEELDFIPATAYAEALPRRSWIRQERTKDPTIESAWELYIGAAELSCQMPGEKEWTRLLGNLVFKEQTGGSGDAKYYEMAEEVRVAGEDVSWTDSDRIRNLTKDYIKLKHPKPDIYLGFPIYDPKSVNGFSRMPFFENFTADVLYHLSFYDLPSSLTSSFRRQMSMRNKVTNGTSNLNNQLDRIKDHDLLCFPWTIVEVKPQNAPSCDIEYGCCQAANAASVSLSVLEKLISYNDTQHEGQNIPPVFTFTVVGADIRLWIAYSATKEVGDRDHRMICIWRASIRKFWGAFQLCQIVGKLYFWAIRILKPQISSYIDQWRHRHIFGVGMLRKMLAQEGNAEISEIVDVVERRLSAFNIGKSKLEDLISQIIIQKELLLQFKAAGLLNETSSTVFNTVSPSITKQPSAQGKKSVNGKKPIFIRSGRKSAPDSLPPRDETASPTERRKSDPPKPGSSICESSHSSAGSYMCEDRVHAYEHRQSKLFMNGPTLNSSQPKSPSILTPEAQSSGCRVTTMQLFNLEEARSPCPTAPKRPVSASKNLPREHPVWEFGDWLRTPDKGTSGKGLPFSEQASGLSPSPSQNSAKSLFVLPSQNPPAQPKGRTRSRSHAYHLKEPQVFPNDVTLRTLSPLTSASPFPPADYGAIPLKDDIKDSLDMSGMVKPTDGQSALHPIEILDSQ